MQVLQISAEYALYAFRQLGEISKGLEKASRNRGNQHTKEAKSETRTQPTAEPEIFNSSVIGEQLQQSKTKTQVLADAGIDRRRAAEAEKLAAIPEEMFVEIIEEKREQGNLTKTAVMDAISKPHVSHNGGNNEWYTPKEYIEAAREVMGGIDYDPASSDIAQQVVRAERYDTIETNGLTKTWSGRVWMNPPYSSELIPLFCVKLKLHVNCGDIKQAIILVNNATETGWFNELVEIASAIVFPKGRVKFHMPDGKTGMPLQGQAVVYVGDNPQSFLDVFRQFGWGALL